MFGSECCVKIVEKREAQLNIKFFLFAPLFSTASGNGILIYKGIVSSQFCLIEFGDTCRAIFLGSQWVFIMTTLFKGCVTVVDSK